MAINLQKPLSFAFTITYLQKPLPFTFTITYLLNTGDKPLVQDISAKTSSQALITLIHSLPSGAKFELLALNLT
jgi:hypothetical protein